MSLQVLAKSPKTQSHVGALHQSLLHKTPLCADSIALESAPAKTTATNATLSRALRPYLVDQMLSQKPNLHRANNAHAHQVQTQLSEALSFYQQSQSQQ